MAIIKAKFNGKTVWNEETAINKMSEKDQTYQDYQSCPSEMMFILFIYFLNFVSPWRRLSYIPQTAHKLINKLILINYWLLYKCLHHSS